MYVILPDAVLICSLHLVEDLTFDEFSIFFSHSFNLLVSVFVIVDYLLLLIVNLTFFSWRSAWRSR